MFKNGAMKRMQSAYKKAFQRTGQAMGVEPDPDLALYGTLKPEHFQELMKVYGEEDIVKYIQDMESKRIMNGGK